MTEHIKTEEDIKNLERFAWLLRNSKENLLHPKTLSSDFPDLRTHWTFPTLICSGPVGGYLTLPEAIDIQIELEKSKQS